MDHKRINSRIELPHRAPSRYQRSLAMMLTCGIAASLVTGCQRWSSETIGESWATPLKVFRSDAPESEPEDSSATDHRPTVPLARSIRFEGHEVVLGDSEVVSCTPLDLLTRVREEITAGHWIEARSFILAHTDTARQTLLQLSPAECPDLGARLIATTLDSVGGSADWNHLLADRMQRSAMHDDYQAARARTMASMQNGDMGLALSGELPAHASRLGHAVLTADAWRLVGIAHLIAESPDQAVLAWRQGVDQPNLDLATRADLVSLQALAWQRMSRDQEAALAWQDSLRAAVELCRRDAEWTDHRFWKRAVEFGESRTDWPSDVVVELQRMCSRDLGPGLAFPLGANSGSQGEALAWSYLGLLSLRCDLPQAALVAFKRGESGLPRSSQGWLRLAQAQALVALGQGQAATMLLGILANDSDVTLKQAAQATLGSTRASSGSIEQGLALLERGLASSEAVDWPGQAAFRADLALSYLMVGREEQGLAQLRRAQDQFHASGDMSALVQSLENEARYFEAIEQADQAVALHGRIRDLEQRFAIH